MASNSKPKPSAKESPAEPFKLVVGGVLRALTREPTRGLHGHAPGVP
jgi:hypothetical protein